jgi:uncharacterized protein YjbI with pentapeptide repeats
MSGAAFENANLSGLKLTDCNLQGAAFEDANLSGLKLTDCNLQGAAITESRIDGMTIDGVLVTDLFAAYQASRDAAVNSA